MIRRIFDIRYTHSVHKTPVQESYYVSESGEIVQYELAYENFAIGMPSNAECRRALCAR